MTLKEFRDKTKDLDGSQELKMADNLKVTEIYIFGDLIYISDADADAEEEGAVE